MTGVKKLLKDNCYELLLSLLVILASGCVLFFNHLYLFELMFSFAPHVTAGAIGMMVFFTWHKSYLLATACAAGAVLFSISLGGKTEYRQHIPHSETTVKVAHFNVLALNNSYDAMAQAALDTNADVISFQEFTFKWEKALTERLGTEYPHRVLLPEVGTGGLALYSKLPFTGLKTICLAGNNNIFATIDTPRGAVDLIATHTKDPVTYNFFKNRNKHIRALAQMVPNHRPCLVIGDLNIVPWSSHFMPLKAEAGLMESRSSYSSTFPAGAGFLQITIDYILHNNLLDCAKFESIAGPGSDHNGIVGEYFIR